MHKEILRYHLQQSATDTRQIIEKFVASCTNPDDSVQQVALAALDNLNLPGISLVKPNLYTYVDIVEKRRVLLHQQALTKEDSSKNVLQHLTKKHSKIFKNVDLHGMLRWQ